MNSSERTGNGLPAPLVLNYTQGNLSASEERAKQLLQDLGMHKAEGADLYVRIMGPQACDVMHERLREVAPRLT